MPGIPDNQLLIVFGVETRPQDLPDRACDDCATPLLKAQMIQKMDGPIATVIAYNVPGYECLNGCPSFFSQQGLAESFSRASEVLGPIDPGRALILTTAARESRNRARILNQPARQSAT